MDQISKLLVLLVTISGPVLIGYAVVAFVRTQRFVRNCAEANGEVIRLERSKDHDQYGYTYAPVFSFTAADEKEYTVISSVGSSPAGFSVGDAVRVIYDPANPEDARIRTFFQTWGAAVIAGGVGVIFVGVGSWQLGLLRFG